MFSAVTEAPITFRLESIYIINKYGQKHFSASVRTVPTVPEKTLMSHTNDLHSLWTDPNQTLFGSPPTIKFVLTLENHQIYAF